MSDGAHALVTGAGSGIGRAVALQLAAQGLRVSLAGRRAAPLEAVQDEIAGAGGSASVHADFDVRDERTIERGVADAIARHGDVAILVNCAGQAPSAPFDSTTRSLWDDVLAVNLTGAYQVTKLVLPSMRRRPFGRIVNIASTAGLIGYPYVSAYCAAKHGLIGLTRALALELAKTSITVNAVCPGFTDTPLLDTAIDAINRKTGRSVEDSRATLSKSNPQGRLVQPAEVAAAVRFLIDPATSSVNGQTITIDGGETARR